MTPTEYFKGKTVLVTGAGGSIGSEICRQLVEFSVRELRMVGHSEAPLYDIERQIRAPNVKTILASVCDHETMLRATQGAHIVIHAAAHKHVPLCEQNPLEAILNNVGGTMTLADAAHANGVPRFILVSSDKAVKPASVMGATKRACELYVNYLHGRSATEFTTVRFGNVLNSSGSVLPLWREQLAAGKPITLTDKRCTRYFMSIPDAVNLTLAAAVLSSGTFVLDMGEPRSLYEMAIETIREVVRDKMKLPLPCSKGGIAEAWIVETGLRPGEKLTEELSYGNVTKTSVPRVLAVLEWGKTVTGGDFWALTSAAKTSAKEIALARLREIVS